MARISPAFGRKEAVSCQYNTKLAAGVHGIGRPYALDTYELADSRQVRSGKPQQRPGSSAATQAHKVDESDDSQEGRIILLMVDFKSEDVDKHIVKDVFNRVVQALDSSGYFSVITSDIEDPIIKHEQKKVLVGCEEEKEEDCWVKVGKLVNAKAFVKGEVSTSGNKLIVSLCLIAGGVLDAGVLKETKWARYEIPIGDSEALQEQTESAIGMLVERFLGARGIETEPTFLGKVWNGITERPYRTSMWASIALSAGGLIVGGIYLFKAMDVSGAHSELLDNLLSEGRATGSPGNYRFVDEKARAQYGPRLDELKEQAEGYETVYTYVFIGTGVLLGMAGLFYLLDDEEKEKEDELAGVTGRFSLQATPTSGILNINFTF